MLIQSRRNPRQRVGRGGKGQNINGRPSARAKRYNLLLASDDVEVAQSDPCADPKAKSKTVTLKCMQKTMRMRTGTIVSHSFEKDVLSIRTLEMDDWQLIDVENTKSDIGRLVKVKRAREKQGGKVKVRPR